MTLRTIQEKDIEQCIRIWIDIFGDSPVYTSWFFHNRFAADYGVCCEDNGKIVSVIHAYPMPVKYLGVARKGAIVGGISTLPEYRGRGLMHRLMDFLKENLLSKGVEVFTYTAVNPEVYYSCDHYPCTERGYFTYINKFDAGVRLTTEFNCQKALDCYCEFAKKYDGIILRDYKLMELRSQDLFTEKCGYYALEDKAYCFVAMKDGNAAIQEVCYKNPEDIFVLFSGLQAKEISGFIPADFPQIERFSNLEIKSHATIVPITASLIPAEPVSLSIGKRTEKLLLCPSTFIWEEY